MISILTEAAHALFYTTGGACCGFFLAALCHAAGNDSNDRRLTESLAERERIIRETMEIQQRTNDHQRRTKELQDQRHAEIAKWAASLAAREGALPARNGSTSSAPATAQTKQPGKNERPRTRTGAALHGRDS